MGTYPNTFKLYYNIIIMFLSIHFLCLCYCTFFGSSCYVLSEEQRRHNYDTGIQDPWHNNVMIILYIASQDVTVTIVLLGNRIRVHLDRCPAIYCIAMPNVICLI